MLIGFELLNDCIQTIRTYCRSFSTRRRTYRAYHSQLSRVRIEPTISGTPVLATNLVDQFTRPTGQ